MATEKKDIRAYSLTELQDFFVANGDKAFRGKQVYQWLWNKGIHQFEGMTNLSKDTRAFLEEHFTINHIAAVFVPVLFGGLWLISPAAVFFAGAAMAGLSLVLSFNVPRHPGPGEEVVIGHRGTAASVAE